VHLARLRDQLPGDVPLLFLPYLFTRSNGIRRTHQVADHLAEELL
jgi:hypothetical protein